MKEISSTGGEILPPKKWYGVFGRQPVVEAIIVKEKPFYVMRISYGGHMVECFAVKVAKEFHFSEQLLNRYPDKNLNLGPLHGMKYALFRKTMIMGTICFLQLYAPVIPRVLF